MKSALVVGGLVAIVTVAVIGTTAVTTVLEEDRKAEAAQISMASCNASLGPITSGPSGSGADDAANLTEEARTTVAMIIQIGKERNLPPLAWQVAIQAGMTESGLRS